MKIGGLAAGILLGLVAGPVSAREISLEDRVRYQRAIEEVYWSHRIWPAENPTPKPPLSEVMTDEAIRARVEDYLKKSTALEAVWQRPVRGEQLQAEIDRMARETQDGTVLVELFHALGDDPFLVAETLARQTLVDRLARDWYEGDATTFEAWWANERVKLPAAADTTKDSYELASPNAVTCTEGTWGPPMPVQNLRARVWHSGVWTGSEMIIWGGRHECSTCASYAEGARYIPATNTWGPVPRFNAPSVRMDHTAVWTGTEMIVWGGAVNGLRHTAGDFNLPFPECLNTGSRYNPMTQTWTPISTGAGVPSARQSHTAVWTGSVMVVWGGFYGAALSTGAMYDPSSDSWTPTSSVGAPSGRNLHTAVWTGSQMIVWGGSGDASAIALNDGARFDPKANTWTSMSGVSAPSVRYEHTAVWDGSGMIVWGGANGSNALQTGGRYVPATDTWTATPLTAGVPSSRLRQSAVWTGTRMIVWGGQVFATGGGINTGSTYDPVAQAWTAVSTLNAPSGRFATAAVWTGTEMIVWGGASAANLSTCLNTGGRYDPASNTWVPTPLTTLAGPPSPRVGHASVWTGAEMIVWGGFPSTFGNTCARYTPATHSWVFPASRPDTARNGPTAVWTGTEMIVWGGAPTESNPVSLGNRYNPTTDVWSSVSDIGTPSVRINHSAVWTGYSMVIWGGKHPTTQVPTNTGGRYDPASNTWSGMSLTGAPSQRLGHRAVWTGSTMVVWGGTPGGSTGLDSGGRYDPVDDAWTPTSLGPGVPSPRFNHATVWTGSRMIVWSGSGAGVGSTGALYDPVADTWSAMSAVNVPTERQRASAVWTGTEMIVWGGLNAAQAPLKTGGRYNPWSDTWATTSISPDTPIARYAHTAEWTGREVVVWGGNDDVLLETNFPEAGMSSGGAYCVNGCASPTTFYRDADGDGFGTASLPALACAQPVGFSTSSTDCNDANAGINPGATEACNGVDLNCDGVGDTVVPPEIAFGAIARLGPATARYPWSTVPGTRYDVLRGAFAGAVGSDPLDESCVGNDVSTTFWDDASTPAPGTFSWFLARSVNSCGDGTLGFATNHATPTAERISLACP